MGRERTLFIYACMLLRMLLRKSLRKLLRKYTEYYPLFIICYLCKEEYGEGEGIYYLYLQY